jgi:phosphoribosylformylglycinamidine synthase
MVLLVGETREELGGSEFARTCLGVVAGAPPRLDLELEKKTDDVMLRLIDDGLLRSAHDVSDGGLAIAIAESCLLGNIGANCDGLGDGGAGALFSESQARFLVSCEPRVVPHVRETCRRNGIPVQVIGLVGGDAVRLGKAVNEKLDSVRRLYQSALA